MPPEKGKESQKGRNRIKESQKGRRRKGPDCLQSQLKTQKRKEFCKFQKNEKCSFFLFPVYATGPYRVPVLGGGGAANPTKYAVPAVALGQVALSLSILSALAAAAAAVFAFELCCPKLGGVRHVDIWAVD